MSTGTSIFPVSRSSCCTAHSSLESQGMVKVPSSCCHTPVKGLVWADVFVTAVTPIFLLLFYLVTNEKDKCWKWRISNVTRAHPARKNLKHRANMEGILFTEFRADWKKTTLTSPLQKFIKFPFEDSPVTALLTGAVPHLHSSGD